MPAAADQPRIEVSTYSQFESGALRFPADMFIFRPVPSESPPPERSQPSFAMLPDLQLSTAGELNEDWVQVIPAGHFFR